MNGIDGSRMVELHLPGRMLLTDAPTVINIEVGGGGLDFEVSEKLEMVDREATRLIPTKRTLNIKIKRPADPNT